MVSSSQHRGRASIIFIFVLIVSLFLFALYLKANPDFLRTPSTHISSHVKIWADPYQSIALELRQVLLLSIVILFSALLITPKISTLVGWISAPKTAPPNLFFGSRRWSRPPPAL